MSLLLYNHALKDLGLRETPGKRSTPRIYQAIKQSALWLDGDDSVTSWCGCIRGLWGFETRTGVPKDHYRAASWAKWANKFHSTTPLFGKKATQLSWLAQAETT